MGFLFFSTFVIANAFGLLAFSPFSWSEVLTDQLLLEGLPESREEELQFRR